MMHRVSTYNKKRIQMNKIDKMLTAAGIGMMSVILVSAIIMLSMGIYFTPFFM